MTKATLFFSASLAFFACNNPAQDNKSDSVMAASDTSTINIAPKADTANPDLAHNSRNSVNWPGSYYGILPCADCPGIETTITLNENLTYTKETKYQDRQATADKEEGGFLWDADGREITLNGIHDGSNKYLVGENVLYALDLNGNKISGPNAESYILKKKR